MLSLGPPLTLLLRGELLIVLLLLRLVLKVCARELLTPVLWVLWLTTLSPLFRPRHHHLLLVRRLHLNHVVLLTRKPSFLLIVIVIIWLSLLLSVIALRLALSFPALRPLNLLIPSLHLSTLSRRSRCVHLCLLFLLLFFKELFLVLSHSIVDQVTDSFEVSISELFSFLFLGFFDLISYEVSVVELELHLLAVCVDLRRVLLALFFGFLFLLCDFTFMVLITKTWDNFVHIRL